MPLIDWFTVIAQVINFLILVWLLKHFLYKPILNAIDAREKKVADELANANSKKADAEKEKEDFKHKNEEFDRQRATLMNKAKDDAKAENQRILEEVRKEASELRTKQQEALKNNQQHLSQEIGRRTQQEIFNIARKVLKDLAGTSLEERAVDVFAQRLHNMDGDEKKLLVSALGASPNKVVVRTAFELPQVQRDSIKKTIEETLGLETQPKFETAPDLISGIELTTDGQKVAWSIADYLASLQKSIDDLLKEQTRSEAKTEPDKDNRTEPDNKSETEKKSEPGKNKPKSKTESGAVNEPDSKYHKPQSKKILKTEQEQEQKRDLETGQESGTKSESLAKQD